MERGIYTPEQVKTLLTNPNVANCTPKTITYSKEFKIRAIKEYYEQGLSPIAIFSKADFDLNALGTDKPKDCLKR